MYISKVSLVNYRNFVNAYFNFNKGINTVIGENGSGKTNVFKAIRLLLEDASLQFAYKLTEGDFNRTLDKGRWKGHWIIISIEFDELNDEARKLYSDSESLKKIIVYQKNSIEKFGDKLSSLNPIEIINKGYAIIDKDKAIITTINQISADDIVNIKLSDGIATAKIISVRNEDRKNEKK